MTKSEKVVSGLSFGILVATLAMLNRFMDFVESRPGVVLQDPFLSTFQPVDVSQVIFFLLYTSVAVTAFQLWHNAKNRSQAFLGFAVLMWVRMLVMYLVPLDPPSAVILLRDPVVEFFAGGSRILTRDLFFSGHTAAVHFCSLAVPNKNAKLLLTLFAVLTGALVLAQHAHYTIDVIAAYFFSYVIFKGTGRFLKAMGHHWS